MRAFQPSKDTFTPQILLDRCLVFILLAQNLDHLGFFFPPEAGVAAEQISSLLLQKRSLTIRLKECHYDAGERDAVDQKLTRESITAAVEAKLHEAIKHIPADTHEQSEQVSGEANGASAPIEQQVTRTWWVNAIPGPFRLKIQV